MSQKLGNSPFKVVIAPTGRLCFDVSFVFYVLNLLIGRRSCDLLLRQVSLLAGTSSLLLVRHAPQGVKPSLFPLFFTPDPPFWCFFPAQKGWLPVYTRSYQLPSATEIPAPPSLFFSTVSPVFWMIHGAILALAPYHTNLLVFSIGRAPVFHLSISAGHPFPFCVAWSIVHLSLSRPRGGFFFFAPPSVFSLLWLYTLSNDSSRCINSSMPVTGKYHPSFRLLPVPSRPFFLFFFFPPTPYRTCS